VVSGKDLVIKAARRPISISTDIILGFPGETSEDFIQTMDLLAEVQYDCVFGSSTQLGQHARARHD